MDSYAIEWLRGLFHSFNFLHHDEILADRHVSGLSPVTKQSPAILTARSVQSIAAQPHTMVDVPISSCIDGDELQVGNFGGPKNSERFSSWWSRFGWTRSRAMTASVKVTLSECPGLKQSL